MTDDVLLVSSVFSFAFTFNCFFLFPLYKSSDGEILSSPEQDQDAIYDASKYHKPDPMAKPPKEPAISVNDAGTTSNQSNSTPELSEEEDIDDDVLYLRLMALRSMAPELEDPMLNKEVEQSEALVDEMNDLLDEADEAAKERNTQLHFDNEKEESVDEFLGRIMARSSDQDNSNLDMAPLIKKLRKSLAKKMAEEESYSPTQSPVISDHEDSSPVIRDFPSPASDYNPLEHLEQLNSTVQTHEVSVSTDDFEEYLRSMQPTEVKDNTESAEIDRKENLEDKLSCTDKTELVDLKKTETQESTTSETSQKSNTTEMNQKERKNKNEEVKVIAEIRNSRRRKPVPSVTRKSSQVEDAETKFFDQQKEEQLFPASVWDFQSKPQVPEVSTEKPKTMQEVMCLPDEADRYKAFLEAVTQSNVTVSRKRSKSPLKKKESNKKMKLGVPLSRPALPIKKRKSEVSRRKHIESDDEDIDKLRHAVLLTMSKKKGNNHNTSSPKVPEIVPLGRSKSVVEPPRLSLKVNEEPVKDLRVVLPSQKRIVNKHKTSKVVPTKKSQSVTLTSAEMKILRIQNLGILKSKAIRKRHFPNLFKKVIIQLDPNEDSENEDDEAETVNQSGFNAEFNVNLDLLMREGRRNAETETKKGRIQPRVESKPVNVAKDKDAPMSASIKHLSKAKQMQYKLLKKRLSIKMKEAEERKKQLTLKQKADPSNISSHLDAQVIAKPISTTTKTSATNSRALKKPVATVKPTSLTLKEKEAAVVATRKALMSNLFKISAQLSSLKDAKAKQASMEAFVADLMKQLEEASELLTQRKERVAELTKEVILSESQIKEQSMQLKTLERDTHDLGATVTGSNYEIPSTHAPAIDKKLMSISKITQSLNLNHPTSTVVREARQCSISDNSGSSLEHLKATNHVTIDPHKELCHFDLMGKCNDDMCQYQHARVAS